MYLQKTLNYLETITNIPSVTKNELEITNYFEHWGKGLQKYKFLRFNNVILMTPKYCELENTLLLVGHTDTVPPWNEDEWKYKVINKNTIQGLGVSDMKASLAIMMVLAEAFNSGEISQGPGLLFYDQEEGPFPLNGLGPFLEAHADTVKPFGLSIAMEPTDNEFQLGCVGSIQADYIFTGKAAHSARPWHGENAIQKAGDFLNFLKSLEPQSFIMEGLEFKEVLNATLASGGRAKNVIPDNFSLNLNYRFAPPKTIPEAEAHLHNILMDLGGTLNIKDSAPCGLIPQENALWENLQNSFATKITPKQAWTDVARFSQLGYDALNYGPGLTSQAHQKNEFIKISYIQECLEKFLEFYK